MQGPKDSTTKHDDEGKVYLLYKTWARKEHLLPFSHIDNSTSPQPGKLIFSTCGELASKHCSPDPPIREDGNHRMPNHIQAQLF